MVVKIAKRGLMQFQFGDDEPILTMDVVEVSDTWHEVNFALRILESDMWILPQNKVGEFAVNRLNFVQGVVNDAYTKIGKPYPTITRFEAEEFIRHVQKETETLRNFTLPKTEESSSAPESTATGTFSQ